MSGIIDIVIKGAKKNAGNPDLDKLSNFRKQSSKIISRTASDLKNRAPSWVNQSVSEVYGIKKKEVSEDFKGPVQLEASNKGIVNFGLKWEGELHTLRAMNMKPTKPPTKREKDYRRIMNPATGDFQMVKPIKPYQVSVEVFKGDRKTLGGNIFLGSHNNSPYLPFIRKSDNRKDITVLKTLSSAQMIENEKVKEKIYKNIDENVKKRFEHNVEQALEKI